MKFRSKFNILKIYMYIVSYFYFKLINFQNDRSKTLAFKNYFFILTYFNFYKFYKCI